MDVTYQRHPWLTASYCPRPGNLIIVTGAGSGLGEGIAKV
jgi:NADP-dependent 3-hydroxy acid dehydrogenase YdfG